jgi:hypothetical protein
VGKAGGKGILLWDYIKSCDEPEHVVRMKLERGELRYTWFEVDGIERSSDDGPRRPAGWWLRCMIDREEHSVKPGYDTSLRWVSGPDYDSSVYVGQMYRVKVFPAVTAADTPAESNTKEPPRPKFQLVLEILADIEGLPSGLSPAEIERKVKPELLRRWAKLRPDDQPKLGRDGKAKPPVERTTINRAYRQFLKARSSK